MQLEFFLSYFHWLLFSHKQSTTDNERRSFGFYFLNAGKRRNHLSCSTDFGKYTLYTDLINIGLIFPYMHSNEVLPSPEAMYSIF